MLLYLALLGILFALTLFVMSLLYALEKLIDYIERRG